MINTIVNYKMILVSFIILFCLDFVYVFIQQEWYKQEIIKMQGSELDLKWSGVLLRYISQIIGLNIFVLQRGGGIIDAFIYGLIIYSNYIGTNYATVRVFDETLAITDLLKGGIVMVLTTAITYRIL